MPVSTIKGIESKHCNIHELKKKGTRVK